MDLDRLSEEYSFGSIDIFDNSCWCGNYSSGTMESLSIGSFRFKELICQENEQLNNVGKYRATNVVVPPLEQESVYNFGNRPPRDKPEEKENTPEVDEIRVDDEEGEENEEPVTRKPLTESALKSLERQLEEGTSSEISGDSEGEGEDIFVEKEKKGTFDQESRSMSPEKQSNEEGTSSDSSSSDIFEGASSVTSEDSPQEEVKKSPVVGKGEKRVKFE